MTEHQRPPHIRDDAPLPHPRRRAGRWLLLLLGIVPRLLLSLLWEIAEGNIQAAVRVPTYVIEATPSCSR